MSTCTDCNGLGLMGEEPIYTYTVQDAIEDGVLFDARELPGEAGEMTRKAYRGNPAYLTGSLRHLIQETVDHPTLGADWAGVWWDVLWMSRRAVKVAAAQADEHGSGYGSFELYIGRDLVRILVAVNGDGLTFMLPGDD